MTDIISFQQARLARDARFDGQFFVAVKSTGIFCRPICPANPPKEQNVEYYPLAELAMQAGYRPCLRCRPDSAPYSCAWKGVDTTVERALTLLAEFPELSLEQISSKLGISDRYLRKLFKQKVGIGAKQYQLCQQMLFAKKLLHETSLNIEQVAAASGFQSSRRLQDNLKKTLQLTPKQIRSSKHIQHKSLRLSLSFRPPYNWPQLRDFLAMRAVPDMEWVSEDSYARTFSLDGVGGYFCARYQHDSHQFLVELDLQNLSILKPVLAQIRRILDLDADSHLIERHFEDLGMPRQDIVSGLRLPGVWSPFEAGCRAILGQQISVTAAIKLLSKLVHQLGSEQDGRYSFPPPQAVMQSDLTFLGMPNARRETLRRLAEYQLEDPTDELQNWLKIKGIGPWTVDYARMRGQSNPDIWLGTDLVIKKRLAQLQLDPQLAAPWRSYLTFQLWSRT
ncbi:DNA-3-methyladenine glycosylase 2 family protein [Neptunicella sp. SCSIO 80796]|uniref:DNA-3-methyladenine glycosylase 2 family protein n=1 Tax=Neptunicella plasticusilytica TaxID=3117012 RepID=UPI003A4E3825